MRKFSRSASVNYSRIPNRSCVIWEIIILRVTLTEMTRQTLGKLKDTHVYHHNVKLRIQVLRTLEIYRSFNDTPTSNLMVNDQLDLQKILPYYMIIFK